MDIVWAIAGILALAVAINILYVLTNNFVFVIGKHPIGWLAIVFGIAVAVWFVSSFLQWSVSIPAWACTLFLMRMIGQDQQFKDLLGSDGVALTDELDAESGIKHFWWFSRAGLVVFAIASALAWIAFYGQVCTSRNECQSLLGVLLR